MKHYSCVRTFGLEDKAQMQFYVAHICLFTSEHYKYTDDVFYLLHIAHSFFLGRYL